MTICNHQADSQHYVRPDVWSGDLQVEGLRIHLLARRNLLWDIQRLPSSRRAALGLYVIFTLWRAPGTNQPPYALLHRSLPRYTLCHGRRPFSKSMVIDDTEYPYWDQVSLNNTNLLLVQNKVWYTHSCISLMWFLKIERILSENKTPILVGGTYYYTEALLWKTLLAGTVGNDLCLLYYNILIMHTEKGQALKLMAWLVLIGIAILSL